MLREYVVSEAMHALGIPTTRSLAVVATGRPVHRETLLPGAVLARVASSHLRVGSFQYARGHRRRRPAAPARRPRDRPAPPRTPPTPSSPYLALFEAVVAAQASLVARWMLVGFVHGVMNTDNMTISGETIDYGPCAFMDAFDPATVYSSIDHGGRYAYGNQPVVAEWNLARLAEALLPLLARRPGAGGRARGGVARRVPAAVRRRLVGRACGPSSACPAALDDAVVAAAGRRAARPAAATSHVDYTSFFRAPRHAPPAATPSPPAACSSTSPAFDAWLERWRAARPGRRRDGPGQPGLHPAQPPRRGGAGRRDRRRPDAARSGCWTR